ncbi:hypothetical protein HYZ41_02710 [archaeon]|nr:hypothetical protein [archaeon]
MGSALYFEKTISLSPLEQRYVASCDCVEGYRHNDVINEWKNRLFNNSKTNTQFVMSSFDILQPFPTLAYLISSENLGYDWSVQDYFEGFDKSSHNSRLRDIISHSSKNANIPEKAMMEISRHVEDCSVKLAKSDGSRAWCFNGFRPAPLSDFFGIRPQSEYVLTHGRNGDGIIVIREIGEEDAAKWMDK